MFLCSLLLVPSLTSPPPCTLRRQSPWVVKKNGAPGGPGCLTPTFSIFFLFFRGSLQLSLCRGLELLKCKVQSISCWANMGFTSHALWKVLVSTSVTNQDRPIGNQQPDEASSTALIGASRRDSKHPPNPAGPYSSASPPGSGDGGAALWYVAGKPPLPYLGRGVFEMSVRILGQDRIARRLLRHIPCPFVSPWIDTFSVDSYQVGRCWIFRYKSTDKGYRLVLFLSNFFQSVQFCALIN